MRTKLRIARKTTSSLSKREKMRRKPLSRRKSLLISVRLRYMDLSYYQGRRRLILGGTTGIKPKSRASWKIWLSS
jgi:hypothetical protein